MSPELDSRDLKSVDEAVSIIDGVSVTSPRVVELSLLDATHQSRVLAEDVLADRDFPPFDKSLMDGFAVRFADSTEGADLRVIGEAPAGAAFDRVVGGGEAVAIMTGAPIPAGADCVVPIEHVDVSGGGAAIRVRVPPNQVGQAIARRGSDVPGGAVVLAKGSIVNAAAVAVAASVGRATLRVFDRPRVCVLTTGDEIVGHDEVVGELGPARIRDSNGPMLAALLERLGCEVIRVDRARDDRALIRARVEDALEVADILFVAGGVSVGARDFLPGVLEEIGFRSLITKLRIKPGKPFVFATRQPASQSAIHASPQPPPTRLSSPKSAIGWGAGAFVFALPGNPVSAFCCTLRLASRLIRRMQGLSPEPRWIAAPLAEALPANGPREFYLPAMWDGVSIRPLPWIGSADVFTLAKADVLLARPENDGPRDAGEIVRALEIPH